MSYLHINNLYKAQEILAFRTCYALEKIHGTSAHISWKDGAVDFFSGGEAHDRFIALFQPETLRRLFLERFPPEDHVTIYGEAYGGKQQGMSHTYGTALKFVVFDVKIGETWLAVPQAAELTAFLGLEFVDYQEIPTDLTYIDAERDKPSTQAVRNGIMEPKVREGIVLRPPFEVTLNSGARVIAKYKRAEFSERGRPHVELDPSKRELLEGAEAIAREWVTPMRLEHVINTLLSVRDSKSLELCDTQIIIRAMIEDVIREAAAEILDSKAARRAISQHTVQLFKQRLQTR